MRYFIELSYLGTHYHGWQTQPNAITVQQTVEKALSLLLRYPIKITGAGRTDTGVHARQMFAHFDTTIPFNPSELTYKLNSFLPEDIAIHQIFSVHPQIHARFDAVSRSYSYYIHQRKNPFLNKTSWYFKKKLDIEKMNMASNILLSYTDFKSFSKVHTDVKTYICHIKTARWKHTDQQLVFSITADRFLRNMVRAIVGTLIDVGTGRTSIDEFIKIIELKNRNNAGFSVPAKGLFLEKIAYNKQIKL